MKKVFFLLYEVKNSNINWIVDIDSELNKNFIKVTNYVSDEEIYKIYSRFVPDSWFDYELNYTKFRFKNFIVNENDELLYKTLLNNN